MDPEEPRRKPNAAGFMPAHGLYDPAYEHDACGVGFIARLDAQPNHQVVLDAVQILVNLEHRGAVAGDKATGDGAGLLLQIPDAFLRRQCAHQNLELPKREANSENNNTARKSRVSRAK